MKKVLLLAAALMMISSAASAQLDGWLDIFVSDLVGGHIVGESCVYPTGLSTPVDVYFIARPPSDGLRATECKIVMPDSCAILYEENYHPDVNVSLGDWDTGMSVSFFNCQTEPAILVCHLQWVTDTCPWSTDCQVIVLGPHDESGLLGGATCAQGYPLYDAAHCCDVYLNCADPCSPIATKEESWGAIKSMYK